MRRFVVSAAALSILVLLFAAPAAAAPPVKNSRTQEFLFAVSSDCGPATCTDTFVDVFTVSDETLVVCLFESTFNIHTGRNISEDGAVPDEGPRAMRWSSARICSSASLSPTEVTFFDCNQQGCVEGDTVTVAAELTARGQSSPTSSVRRPVMAPARSPSVRRANNARRVAPSPSTATR